jgi:trigger factor
MKSEFTDVSETRKTVAIEIPRDVVDAEINRVAKDYSRQARVPGFRPGKVPATVVKQRFRDQILHDVMHGLIPRAVSDALQERGIEPVDTPDIRDVAIEEGQPLTFTAAVETVPPFDPGDLSTLSATRPSRAVTDESVDKTLEGLRERAATFEPVEGRGAADGDTVVADLVREGPEGPDRHENVSIEIGASANPPGFDAELSGLAPGEDKRFTIHFPDDYAVKEMAGTDVTYGVTVTQVRRKVLPALDDEFAKDLGEFDSLAALRDRVRSDLAAEAAAQAERQVRGELLAQLARRVTFEIPSSLVEREMDRRLEDFVRHLAQQQVDPREAGVDWAQLRESQRESARASVASALALDEIARRESLTVQPDEVVREIEQFAGRSGRTPAAVRAQIEKEGGTAALAARLRREKAVDLALSRASISEQEA